MDFGVVSGVITAVLLITFLAGVAWAWSARQKPALAAPLAALLASVPLLLAYAGLVVFLKSIAQQAPFGLAALLVFGLICLLCGFGLGMVGHMLGARRGR